MPERPRTIASASRRCASSARSISMVRRNPARSNRMVSCGSQASAAPGSDREPHVDGRGRVERAVDLLGRRRGHHQPRIRAGCDVEGETVAARHPARRVDDHGLEFGRRCTRTAHPQRAVLVHAGAAGDAVARLHRQCDVADGAVRREGCRARCYDQSQSCDDRLLRHAGIAVRRTASLRSAYGPAIHVFTFPDKGRGCPARQARA